MRGWYLELCKLTSFPKFSFEFSKFNFKLLLENQAKNQLTSWIVVLPSEF